MPKLIVLFHAADGAAAALADNAAVGAREVRFSEVDVRAVGAAESIVRQRRLESTDQLRDYDGIVIACSTAEDIPTELDGLLADLERTPAHTLANIVFTVVGAKQAPLRARVTDLGGIVVTPARGVDEPEQRAKAAGARAAQVVAWVRHALSHEKHDHEHHHHHEHPSPA